MNTPVLSQVELRKFTRAIDSLEPLLEARDIFAHMSPELKERAIKMGAAISIILSGSDAEKPPLRSSVEGTFEAPEHVLEIEKHIENDGGTNNMWRVRLWEKNLDANPEDKELIYARGYTMMEQDGLIVHAKYIDLTALWNAVEARKAAEEKVDEKPDPTDQAFTEVMLDGMDAKSLAGFIADDLAEYVDEQSTDEALIEADNDITHERLTLVMRPLDYVTRHHRLS